MTVQIRWEIIGISVKDEEPFTDVVTKICWKCFASNEEREVYGYGESILPNEINPDHEFILYENLTEEQVIIWAKEFVVAATSIDVENGVTKLLEMASNPLERVVTLPWQS